MDENDIRELFEVLAKLLFIISLSACGVLLAFSSYIK